MHNERGNSLPDSQILIILGTIFNVSVNELLAGERITEEKKSEETSSKIALSLVDEINIKGRIIKIRTIVFTISFLAILSIFLGYYFINSYNSIKVFKVQGENKNFKTYNGIIISTKQKIYIRLGELIKKDKDNKIENVRLYFKDKNNKEKVLYKDSKTDILIISNHGYNGNFTYDELKYLVNHLYLDINYSNKKNKIKLTVKKDFSNSLNFYNNENKIIEDNNSKLTNPLIYEKIKLNMETKAVKIDKSYKLIIENEQENINIELIDRKLLIKVNHVNYLEVFNCDLNHETTMIYTKIIDNQRKDYKIVTINDTNKLTTEEGIIYDKLTNYINKYILNSN